MPRRKKKIRSIISSHTLNENVIICLPIKKEITDNSTISNGNVTTQEKELFTYNPEITTPLEQKTSFGENCEWIEAKHVPKNETIVNDKILNVPTTQEPNLNKVVCMWCCHSFHNQKYHLPLKYTKKEFVVYGQFCSPECAASYNFNDVIDYSDPWERYSLLHSLYFDMYTTSTIQLAPPRLALDMFGGHLSISQFREINSSSSKYYKISLSPIKHIKLFTIKSNLKSLHLDKKNKEPAITKTQNDNKSPLMYFT